MLDLNDMIIAIKATITPVRALRCITISLPWYQNTSYEKIGKSFFHKHYPDFGYHFNKIGDKYFLKERLFNDDGDEVYRDCIGGKYYFR